MLGQAMPVTEVKKMAEISDGVESDVIESFLDGLLAKFESALDP